MSERDLWSAVLLRAADDALYAPNTGGGKVSRILDAAAARSYLTKRSKDLATICEIVGIDMDALIERMRQRIANAKPLPTPRARKRKPTVKTKGKRRSGPIMITLSGETLTVREWSERTGVKPATIHDRLRKGWSAEEALDAS